RGRPSPSAPAIARFWRRPRGRLLLSGKSFYDPSLPHDREDPRYLPLYSGHVTALLLDPTAGHHTLQPGEPPPQLEEPIPKLDGVLSSQSFSFQAWQFVPPPC